MEKEVFIKNRHQIRLIAHRLGYSMTPYPENSLMAIEYIFQNKEILNSLDGFEFDICFTKDNIPVITHDKYIDDITNQVGLIKSYNYSELKNMDFNFRNSLGMKEKVLKYKILSFEELLQFFQNNYDLLQNKTIKFETKDFFKTSKKLKLLATILQKFPLLSKNLIHLSYYPTNLSILKNIERKKQFTLIKTDLLCENKCELIFPKFMKNIDCVSLRVKTKNLPKLKKQNSIRVNKKIFLDRFFMKISDAYCEKTLKYAIKTFGQVGLFTVNKEEIEEFCKKISEEFFIKNLQKIILTTDEPFILRNL